MFSHTQAEEIIGTDVSMRHYTLKSKQMQCKHLQNTYHNRNLFACNGNERKFFKERYNFKFVMMCMSGMRVWISCTLKDTENDKKNISRSVTLIMMSNMANALCLYVMYMWYMLDLFTAGNRGRQASSHALPSPTGRGGWRGSPHVLHCNASPFSRTRGQHW